MSFSASQFLRVGQYNSTLPTLSDGGCSALQVDENGRLIVSQDVNVSIDFLGLNGASDTSNILIVGTEDGVETGTAHAFRLDTGGRLYTILSDGTDDVDVAKEGDAVIASSGGIIVGGRDESDNFKSLEFEGDNLKVIAGFSGSDANEYADAGTDGVVEAISSTFTDIVTDIAVGVGQTLEIYGAWADADGEAYVKVVTKTSAVVDGHYVVGGINVGRAYEPRIPDKAPIIITGAANVTVNLQARKQKATDADIAVSGAIFARLV